MEITENFLFLNAVLFQSTTVLSDTYNKNNFFKLFSCDIMMTSMIIACVIFVTVA